MNDDLIADAARMSSRHRARFSNGREGLACAVKKQLMTERAAKSSADGSSGSANIARARGLPGGDPSLADFEVGEIGEALEMHQPRISDLCLAELSDVRPANLFRCASPRSETSVPLRSRFERPLSPARLTSPASVTRV